MWRFRADLPSSVVRRVARLAAREPGIDLDSGSVPPPERWVMIERLFEADMDASRPDDTDGRLASGVAPRRPEVLIRDGVLLGELWTIE